MNFSLSEKEKQMIISSKQYRHLVETNESDDFDFDFLELPSVKVQSFRCSCEEGHKVIQKGEYCAFCGHSLKSCISYCIPSGIEKFKQGKLKFDGKDNVFPVDNCVYIRYSETNKQVEMLFCRYSVEITKDGNDSDLFEVPFALSFRPGERGHLYAFESGNWIEKDFLSYIKIFTNQVSYLFSKGNSVGFICNYPDVSNMTGLGLFLSKYNFNGRGRYLDPDDLSYNYLLIVSFYPGIERITKMGFGNISLSIVSALAFGKEEYATKKFKDLSRLFNFNESEGKKSFTIPLSAVSFLDKKNASYTNILLFCDFFKKDSSLNNDSFKKLSQTPEFLECFDEIYPGNEPIYFWYSFMNLGKPLKELVMYLGKQAKLSGRNLRTVIQLLIDYMDMCKKLNIGIHELPSNLKNAHDSLAREIHIAQSKETDKKIFENVKRYKPIVIDLNAENAKYRITMPKCSYDLIQEGQEQNNCVGGYVDAVKNRRSTVFFIRKKDEPDKSFITAELKNGHLNQIYYKHNREVKEADILDFANAFVERARKVR